MSDNEPNGAGTRCLACGEIFPTPSLARSHSLGVHPTWEYQRTQKIVYKKRGPNKKLIVQEVPEEEAEEVVAMVEESTQVDTGIIVMTPDPPTVKESEPEVDTYICQRCRGDLEYQIESCPTCGERMKWS